MKKLYIIDYESAHWCGGQSYMVVWARNEVDAELQASLAMEESMRELFSDEYQDDPGLDEECPYSVNSVEEFGPGHEHWEYYQMPDQRAAFYPTIGEEDGE